MEREVEIIKEKLALLDGEEALSTKLITIREVTELATDREREEDELTIKEKYQAMIEEDQYNFKDDLLVLKNFNLESTKAVSESVLAEKSIENNQEVKETKDKK